MLIDGYRFFLPPSLYELRRTRSLYELRRTSRFTHPTDCELVVSGRHTPTFLILLKNCSNKLCARYRYGLKLDRVFDFVSVGRQHAVEL
jgi:hypothetical protein